MNHTSDIYKDKIGRKSRIALRIATAVLGTLNYGVADLAIYASFDSYRNGNVPAAIVWGVYSLYHASINSLLLYDLRSIWKGD